KWKKLRTRRKEGHANDIGSGQHGVATRKASFLSSLSPQPSSEVHPVRYAQPQTDQSDRLLG
ncbi:MAG: hypothetical protein Q8L40_04025, partial [Burkholderiales bacterium]|nr:hypothetical protein [Burkholderiales bacterium]